MIFPMLNISGVRTACAFLLFSKETFYVIVKKPSSSWFIHYTC